MAEDEVPEISVRLVLKIWPHDRLRHEQQLALLRHRLIDIFLGLTTYSLQNHLRTTVKGIGQIEIDELYFGIDREGCHHAIPVQAKGETDKSPSCRRSRTSLGAISVSPA